MDISHDSLYQPKSLDRLAFKAPRPKPRPLYPVLLILLLSALLWAVILVPLLWAIEG
jgi:hypothetical protein